ncbi:hypothetical protein BOSE127_60110 [Bosea sp. 127]|nr:hypothetical protein BOSE7B_40712 [Bosea sp. 7B]VXC83303.1 hypothetical protein BOSE127_60110 [Bosea sp. 127]
MEPIFLPEACLMLDSPDGAVYELISALTKCEGSCRGSFPCGRTISRQLSGVILLRSISAIATRPASSIRRNISICSIPSSKSGTGRRSASPITI